MQLLKSMKGLKLASARWPDAKLFHQIEQSGDERFMGKRVAWARNVVIQHVGFLETVVFGNDRSWNDPLFDRGV